MYPRTWLFLMLILASATASAQSEQERWKIFVEVFGGWINRVGAEIDSNGVLVTHEGKNATMPRCALVSGQDLEGLNESVAGAKEHLAQGEGRSWDATVEDGMDAQLTIHWSGDEDLVTFRIGAGAELPLTIRRLYERVLVLREDAEAACRPADLDGRAE